MAIVDFAFHSGERRWVVWLAPRIWRPPTFPRKCFDCWAFPWGCPALRRSHRQRVCPRGLGSHQGAVRYFPPRQERLGRRIPRDPAGRIQPDDSHCGKPGAQRIRRHRRIPVRGRGRNRTAPISGCNQRNSRAGMDYAARRLLRFPQPALAGLYGLHRGAGGWLELACCNPSGRRAGPVGTMAGGPGLRSAS